VHNFAEQLAFSEKASEEPFWDAVYRKAFPNLVNHMLASGDVKSQRMGVDRVLFLANGKTLYIDEKKRRDTYTDILLEYMSVDNKGTPGWIEKDLAIDYLAYAFMPLQRVYLFPWPLLRRAWLQFKPRWLSKYQIPPAKNNGYNTLSVAVPIEELRKCISTAAIIQL
jgi:hypothetical protein